MSSEKISAPTYQFPKGLEVAAPEGKVAVKFHGNIAYISEAVKGEKLNKAGYTPPQVDDLLQLESARIKGKLVERPTHFFSISIVDFAQG